MTTKDLENYLLFHEQKVQDFVKSRSRNWLIAAAIAFVLLVVLFIVAFIKTTKVNDSYKGQINTLDSVVHYQQTTIDALQRVNASQDSTIYQLDEAYKKNRPTETRIIHQYEKVNTDVRNLSNSQLDSELSKYDY
jgi:septal ring factor EnvC (AmiA/AmiB activator)